MNFDIEEKFIRTFCEKRVVKRFLYELKNDKKRINALWRFDQQFIKRSLITASSNKYSPEELINEIKKLSKSKTCYTLAPDNETNGVEYPLEEGINKLFYYGLAIVFIIDENTAVLKDEQCFGSPTKYILHRLPADTTREKKHR